MKLPNILRYLRHCWLLLPFVPYILAVSVNRTNLPIIDDYDAILQTIITWKHSDWLGKIHLLFSQHGDHRILYSRIIYILYYSVFGDVNFRNLVLLGNCNLLAACAFLVYFIKNAGIRYWQAPAFVGVMLLCDMNTFLTASITMYSWQNHGILFLFFLCLFCWHKRWLWAGVASMFLLIMSSGNGAIGALGIAVYSLTAGRRYAIVCGAAFLLFTASYYIGYHRHFDPNDTPFDLTIAETFFIRMSGAPFSFDYSMFYGMWVIAAIVVYAGIAARSIRLNLGLWPLMTILFFAIGSSVTISVFRSHNKYAQFQQSWYQIYPQLMVALLFVLMMYEARKTRRVVTCGLMALWIAVYYPYNYRFGEAGIMRTQYRVEVLHGLQGDKYWYTELPNAERIAKQACEEDIYCIEDNR